METKNKETVRQLIEEVLNKGNFSVLDQVVHTNYHYQSPNETMDGIDDLRAFVQALRSAFPDLRIQILEQIADEEKVCTRICMTGTQQGDFLGLPATGKAVQLQGVVISRLKSGLIAEEWELLDQLTLLQQLGPVRSLGKCSQDGEL